MGKKVPKTFLKNPDEPVYLIRRRRCLFSSETYVYWMAEPQILDVTAYAKEYSLKYGILCIRQVEPPGLDINAPGLIMHGSEGDPYTILKFGLAPQRTLKNSLEGEWQVCLGLSSKSKALDIKKDSSRKNSAVKYSGYFSPKGAVYVLDEQVKRHSGYNEFWETGQEPRGYAWTKDAIVSDLITAVITENIPKVAAAVAATRPDMLIYRPDGTCFSIEVMD
jgi:hypothetical protein